MNAIPFPREIHYPDSDGLPMAETELHRKEMTYLLDSLDGRFQHDPQVYVGGNMFLYYEPGRPGAVVAPDVFLVRGVPKRERRTYKLWEEGVPPCLVIEVTSKDTRGEDLGEKKGCYERLGVEEYFLYDPTADYLRTRLLGFRHHEGRYQQTEPEPDGSLHSSTAGVTLKIEGSRIRLLDTATGEPLLRYGEQAAAREAAEERARTLQLEVERLRRKLEGR